MRLLADENVDARIVARLRRDGHDVDSVAETQPSIEDDDVLTRSVNAARLLVTSDKDFGELVYRLGRVHCGILLLRLGGVDADRREEFVADVIAAHGERLTQSFTVIDPDAVRIRQTKAAP